MGPRGMGMGVETDVHGDRGGWAWVSTPASVGPRGAGMGAQTDVRPPETGPHPSSTDVDFPGTC